jgi:hypothetical protein
MKRILSVPVLWLAALGVCAGPARAGDPVAALVAHATSDVLSADPSCAGVRAPGPPALVDGGAGPGVAAALGVFRRPATDAERALAAAGTAGGSLMALGAGTLGRDAVRQVVVADGTVVTLAAPMGVAPTTPTRAVYDRCHARVLKLLKAGAKGDRPGTTARQAVARYVRQTRAQRPATDPPAANEGLLATTSGGGIATPFDARTFAAAGRTSFTMPSDRRSARFLFVVPDGVTRIEGPIPALDAKGRKVSGHFGRVGVDVYDNVAVLAVAANEAQLAALRWTWTFADGTRRSTRR